MNLAYDEDQLLLQKTARDFVGQHSPLSRLRALRDDADAKGYSPDLWREMARLGWTGVTLSEEFGGCEMRFSDLCVILEELGRTLMPEPVISTLVLCGTMVQKAGTPSQKDKWLPAISRGEVTFALAMQERRSRYNPVDIQLTATPSGDGFTLLGEKIQVLDARGADQFVVTARSMGTRKSATGVTLFIVDPKSPGVSITPQKRADGRNAALVRFEDVVVQKSAVLGECHDGLSLLGPALDRARIALSAQMLGGSEAAFAMTLAYLKERKQFGVAIGSFQALQHRCADLFVELQLTRSAVMAAAATVDEEPENVPRMASLAKAKAGDCFIHVVNESIQMHGGIGVTDELDLGFYLKRARAAAQTFGDSSFHRERWASLRGY